MSFWISDCSGENSVTACLAKYSNFFVCNFLRRIRFLAAPSHYNKYYPDNYHRQRQQHSHGETAPQESELRVGLAEVLAGDAGQSINQNEAAEDQPGALQRAEADHQRQHREQQDALEAGLIELARMARLRPAIGKDHRPG